MSAGLITGDDELDECRAELIVESPQKPSVQYRWLLTESVRRARARAGRWELS